MDKLLHLLEYELSKKYKQVKVNLDVDDHAQLKLYCDANNITLAEFFRASANYKINDAREPQQKRVHKTTDPKLLYHLNKIGNNLNQIAKHANEGNALDYQVLAELAHIEKTLKDFL